MRGILKNTKRMGNSLAFIFRKRNIKMNRRGDVPTLLIFGVALVFSIAALVAMYSFVGGFDGKSKEFNDLSLRVDFLESYIVKQVEVIGKDAINCDKEVYEDICGKGLEERFKEIAMKKEIDLKGKGNIFGEIRNDKFSFIKEDKGYVLKFDNIIFVKSEVGGNEIVRDFSLVLKFDDKGELREISKVYK